MEKKRAMLIKKMQERQNKLAEKERVYPEILDQNISRFEQGKRLNKKQDSKDKDEQHISNKKNNNYTNSNNTNSSS